MTLARALLVPALACLAQVAAAAALEVVRVGPTQAVQRIADAARAVRPGGTIEIEAGDYRGDVAVLDRPGVTVRGVGGRARLHADGASAERKAILVVRADTTIENLEFHGARVPDQNGAGIRHERGRLTVDRCAFFDNENGILTGNDKSAELVVRRSEFGYNGAGDGYSHDLYAGTIAALSVSDSYFHHARVGHLLKSRAARSTILYNRLSDGAGGRASYELEFPSGGVAIVVGNLIEQSTTTENPTIVSFGAEGYRWPRNALYLVNNTLVNLLPDGGAFLVVHPGQDELRAVDNVLAGPGTFPGPGAERGNHRLQAAELAPGRALRRGSPLIGRAVDPGRVDDMPLRPRAETRAPQNRRPVPATPYSPGAFQIPAR